MKCYLVLLLLLSNTLIYAQTYVITSIASKLHMSVYLEKGAKLHSFGSGIHTLTTNSFVISDEPKEEDIFLKESLEYKYKFEVKDSNVYVTPVYKGVDLPAQKKLVGLFLYDYSNGEINCVLRVAPAQNSYDLRFTLVQV